jgi:hypothetical protein
MHGQFRRDDVTNIRPDLAVLRILWAQLPTPSRAHRERPCVCYRSLSKEGLAHVEIATQLLATHGYGGETVWFYQRLSAACAKHGRPLDF